MKKRYFIIGALVLGVLLNLVPRYESFLDNGSTWTIKTPEVVLQAHGDELVCGMMGALAGYDYNGVPAVAYVPGEECGSNQAIYPLGILLNFMIAAGLSVILYLIFKAVMINTRRKR